MICRWLCDKFANLRVLRIKGNAFSTDSVGRILQKCGLVEIEAPSKVQVEYALLRNQRVLKARNTECKDLSVYDSIQEWGALRDETYKLISENPIFKTWREIKFFGG